MTIRVKIFFSSKVPEFLHGDFNALENHGHVPFLPKFALVLRNYVCKKTVFVVASAHDQKDDEFTLKCSKMYISRKT